jgi:serine O-acetyltransferase
VTDLRTDNDIAPIPPRTVGDAIADLREAREEWRSRQDEARDVESFPSRAALERVLSLLAAALYPRRLGHFRGPVAEEDTFVVAKLLAAITDLEREIGHELGYWQCEAGAFEADHATTIVRLFTATLGDIRRLIDSDVEAAFLGDPAARSVDEILVCYPGAIASLHHRIAHELNNLGAPIVARLISEIANERTVIGETAIIGARVRLYQHVTLGARSPVGATRDDVRHRHARHPIIGDDVVIYAGATILGRVTIGARSTIGGNVWLLSDVPEDSVLVQPEALRLDRKAGLDLRETLLGQSA